MLNQQLSQAEAAKLIGVSQRTIQRWIAAGVLPVQRYPGTGQKPIVRIAEDELEKFVQKHRTGRCTSITSSPVGRETPLYPSARFLFGVER